MTSDHFGDVLSPIVTPFVDGAVDDESLATHANHLVTAGVDGIVACGTTGEFASLTWDERERVIETVVDSVGGRAAVVAGAAATSVEGATARVDRVRELGADAALVPPPYFHGGGDPSGIATFYERVLDRSSGPIVLYNIPGCTGVALTPEVVSDLGGHERVIGLKDSGGDLAEFARFRDALPESVPLYQGWDLLVLPAMVFGATGAVAGLTNVAPGRFRSMLDAFDAGELNAASTITSEELLPLLDACRDLGYVGGIKAALSNGGVIATDEVRPPLAPVDRERFREHEGVFPSLS